MRHTVIVPMLFILAVTVSACSHSGQPDRQRPVYGHQNVDMQPQQSGYDYRESARPNPYEAPSSTDPHWNPEGRR
jgi:hypothetical protein